MSHILNASALLWFLYSVHMARFCCCCAEVMPALGSGERHLLFLRVQCCSTHLYALRQAVLPASVSLLEDDEVSPLAERAKPWCACTNRSCAIDECCLSNASIQHVRCVALCKCVDAAE